MNMRVRMAFAVVALAVSGGAAMGEILFFDLEGRAGAGLLPGNELHTINGNPGSGGEVGAGITFDTVTKQLAINVAWGASNGFNSLTGNATAGHIHGPTTNGGVAGFTQTAGVRLGLDSGPTWNNSATSGGVFGRILTLNSAQESELIAGRWYLNFHTSTNGPGEIRGQILLVPAPGAAALLGVAGLLATRRRR